MLTLSAFRDEKRIELNAEKQRITHLKDILFDSSLDDTNLCSNYGYSDDEAQLKTIEDKSNVPKIVPEKVCPSIHRTSKKANNYFPTRLMTTPLFLQFGAYEQKRRRLAEERRREYNEYLKEKAKLDSERREKFLFRKNSFLTPNYNELLEKKKIENQQFRHANGFDLFDEPLFESPRVNCSSKTLNESKVSQESQWFFGGQECDEEDMRITPRSRLLATRLSRAKAEEYRKELLEQIEEKKRRERIEKEMTMALESKLNSRIEEQRQRMSAEFKEEQMRLGNRQIKAPKKNTARLSAPHCYTPKSKTSKDLGSRSPSYLHVRLAKPEKQNLTKNVKTPDNNVETGEFGQPERPLAVNEEQGDTHISNCENPPEKERVLARLSEVRKKMQEDHTKMLQQLRDKLIV